MLVEFKVKNFRSLRDENILSMVAAADTETLPSNVKWDALSGVPGLLNSCAIYGPNAGGKSNLLRAVQLFRAIVADSSKLQAGQLLNVQPFALEARTKTLPVEMEAIFVKDGVRYQYGFAATPEKVTAEWLRVYKSARAQQWFNRELNQITGEEEFEFGPFLKGEKQIWKTSTRPNALLLSTAVQLNSEQLKPIFDWILDLVVFENGHPPILEHTVSFIRQNPSNGVSELLQAGDTGISSVSLLKRKTFGHQLRMDFTTGKLETSASEGEQDFPVFGHFSNDGEASFEFTDESQGTQRLFSFAGPFFEILRDGKTLFVDELDNSLHPFLVRQLIAMFHDPEINKNGAQLIFTTHDTSLLDPDFLRRDQIWFVSKGKSQASELYPLTDFSVRKNEAFGRGYLSGRYGALPVLDKFRIAH
jgi:uncharacterized protein